MINVTLSQLAGILKGELIGADRTIDAVTTDTRKLTPGCLFVALKGERFDAHDFAATAKDGGAGALLPVYAIGGSFALLYAGARTAPLPANASADAVVAALLTLPTVADASVTRSPGATVAGFSWVISVLATAARNAGDGLGLLAVSAAGLVTVPPGGAVSAALDSRRETQEIVCAAPDAADGRATLRVLGAATVTLLDSDNEDEAPAQACWKDFLKKNKKPKVRGKKESWL